MATNTVLVAKSLDKTTEIPMSEFFKGYRTTALPQDAVIAALRIPIAQESGEYLRAYKQAKRKDDDIAIVNAALRVCLDNSNVVRDVNLIYGGMAPTTVAAMEATARARGKRWTDPDTLEEVMNALEKDFDLRFGVPGGMPTYRKSLALGFFYRFYHEVLSDLNDKTAKVDSNVIAEIEREISFGKRTTKLRVLMRKESWASPILMSLH